MLLIVVFTAR